MTKQKLTLEDQMKLDAMVKNWNSLMDNAKYLGVEHRHKIKEYGIKWRSAFKIEMNEQCD